MAVSHEVVGEIIAVDPATIDPDVQGRIGHLFPLKVEGLACRIKADGQNEPISIAKAPARSKFAWRLVVGRHRHEACVILKRPVLARVVRGSAEELRRLQTSEQLDRRTMTVLENAMFVAAVADAAISKLRSAHGNASQHAIAGRARAAMDKLSSADADASTATGELAQRYGWKSETAEACGLGEKDVQRALRIYRCIVEPHRDLADALKDHPIANNQSALLGIAAKPAEIRKSVLMALLAEPTKAAPADPKALTKKQRLLSRVLKTLELMEEGERISLVEDEVSKLPVGSKRRVYERLAEELGRG